MKTKECSKCGHDLPLDNFYNDSKSNDGKQAQCNECKKNKNKPELKSEKETKKCSRCEHDFPLDNFYNDKKSKDGKQAQCNICKRIRKKKPSKKKSIDDDSKNKNLIKYSYDELTNFRTLIMQKIGTAEESISALKASISGSDSNGTEDTSSSTKGIEDSSDFLVKEEAMTLAARQHKFLTRLKEALNRIDQGTYGICQVTGNLIPKERLMLVPHATTCVNSKNELEKKPVFMTSPSSEESDEEHQQ